MILHRLLWRFAHHRDDAEFYRLQADDAIRWLRDSGVRVGPGVRALDLGCGHGVFGGLLRAAGCDVTFADESNYLLPEHRSAPFVSINLDTEPSEALGQFDLVVCSNVLEHLARPKSFLSSADKLLSADGRLYLSWTNWLSPWGGHEFSPWHYLGAEIGPAVYDRLAKRPRFHKPGTNLFPTYIGEILAAIDEESRLEVQSMAPRYYTEFAPLMRLPIVREFLAWNCALLLRTKRH
jgi:SAM-dependent methyltransferase